MQIWNKNQARVATLLSDKVISKQRILPSVTEWMFVSSQNLYVDTALTVAVSGNGDSKEVIMIKWGCKCGVLIQ